MDDVGRRYPSRVVPAALAEEGAFWRLVFVPLYRRVPWEFKRQAMRKLKMTAQGWPEQSRQFAEPWRPPVAPEAGVSAADAVGSAADAVGSAPDAVRSAPDAVRSAPGNGRSPEARNTAR
jgi:hypothetical protein